jgi:hypothetical protein
MPLGTWTLLYVCEVSDCQISLDTWRLRFLHEAAGAERRWKADEIGDDLHCDQMPPAIQPIAGGTFTTRHVETVWGMAGMIC